MHLIVIGGPTATGKTAIAAELAHRLNADVISADSRQVYRGLDLGSGKDLSEFLQYMPPVRYHLIDIVNADSVFSLYQYQSACYRAIENIATHGSGRRDVVILVGGTGMYIESVLRRYRIANVTENPALRASMIDTAREELEARLRTVDPELASITDLTSKKRIIRALEIHAHGQTRPIEYSVLPGLDWTYTLFITELERKESRRRIDQRLEERLSQGMVEEVRGLMRNGIGLERMRLLGMEYREIAEHLAGLRDYPSMVETLRHQIHLLAKRQETYFRGMARRGLTVYPLGAGDGAEQILSMLGKQNLTFHPGTFP